ncbi:MAG: hypothetical protein ACI9IZ_001868, partial [Nonlabens sp.]
VPVSGSSCAVMDIVPVKNSRDKIICFKRKCNLGYAIFVINNGLVFETSKLHINFKRFLIITLSRKRTNKQHIHNL